MTVYGKGVLGQSDGQHFVKVTTNLGLFWPFWPASLLPKNFDSQTPAFERVFKRDGELSYVGVAEQSDGQHFVKVTTNLGLFWPFWPAILLPKNFDSQTPAFERVFKRDG